MCRPSGKPIAIRSASRSRVRSSEPSASAAPCPGPKGATHAFGLPGVIPGGKTARIDGTAAENSFGRRSHGEEEGREGRKMTAEVNAPVMPLEAVEKVAAFEGFTPEDFAVFDV